MEYINGLPIDGKTEIDDLALVMHIAQSENQRLRELETFVKPANGVIPRSQDHVSDSDSDDSGGDFDTVYRQLQGKYHGDTPGCASRDMDGQAPSDPNFPLDNIRIIDTVDLPVVVADHFPIARVGQCVSVVGRVVVFKCTEPSRILDLGSIVCLHDRRILGTVSDTFGNTSAPFHTVISSDPSMVKAGDTIFYDVKHSTLVTDMNVAETASSVSSDEESDEDTNPKQADSSRNPVKLKQYYDDLETH
ncbi:hypothetical protein X943_001440 [Babesia divergens]|uniref:H/ACA ribonucleoprotein complex subunit n=1 Tax=Babesia divergens TaxID=32595 RepID=A0AAD9GCX8_BABDI|nr:hypothetical protein X943_001440 [Babesia divergens]